MTSKKNKCLLEQFALFQQLDAHILKGRDELRQQYQIAINMACSEWRDDTLLSYLIPVKIFPDMTSIAKKNIDALVSENSRQRYYLIKAFLPVVKELKMQLTQEQQDCFTYWDKKVK